MSIHRFTDLVIFGFVWVYFFFSAVPFLFNGIYTSFFDIDKSQALKLFGIINKPLNIVLYSFIIIGIVCSIRKKKPIIQ